MSENSNEVKANENLDNYGTTLDLQELAQEYNATPREERGLLFSLIITIGFITGPIFLIIDLIFPKLFKLEFIDPTILFTVIALSFLIIAIIKAWKQATRY